MNQAVIEVDRDPACRSNAQIGDHLSTHLLVGTLLAPCTCLQYLRACIGIGNNCPPTKGNCHRFALQSFFRSTVSPEPLAPLHQRSVYVQEYTWNYRGIELRFFSLKMFQFQPAALHCTEEVSISGFGSTVGGGVLELSPSCWAGGRAGAGVACQDCPALLPCCCSAAAAAAAEAAGGKADSEF